MGQSDSMEDEDEGEPRLVRDPWLAPLARPARPVALIEPDASLIQPCVLQVAKVEGEPLTWPRGARSDIRGSGREASSFWLSGVGRVEPSGAAPLRYRGTIRRACHGGRVSTARAATPAMTMRYARHAPEAYFVEDAARIAASLSGAADREAKVIRQAAVQRADSA
jgi:hypothetical protein